MMNEIIAGADIGGTFIKLGLFEKSGQVIEKWQVPTEDVSYCAVLEKTALEIKEKTKRTGVRIERLKGVGIGVPGSIDSQGMLIHAPNLGWSMLNVKQLMKEYLTVPVFIGNDANVAALGEQYFGAGEGCASMVMVTLGTGVGGGVIVNQKLVSGAFGGAGEIGHMVVHPQELVSCNCGKKGCLEQYASATGIVSMARKRLVHALAEADETKEEAVSILQQFEWNAITAKEVFDAVKAGDGLACEVADCFGETLGRALSCVAAVTDPQLFVIGGGVSAAGEILLTYIEKYYRQYAFTPSKRAEFKLATLGNDAGIFGAARLVMLDCC